MNKQRRNLDTRIAEALADEATKASEFNRLIIDVEYALPLNFKALEAERIRMLDPTNSTPNKSKKIVEDITLERERLEAALPILQDRYNKAERRQNVQAFIRDTTKLLMITINAAKPCLTCTMSL